MKKLIQQIWKLAAIVLPLAFLCSCYEIVYIDQPTDLHAMGTLRPDLCIQVYNVNDKPVRPYIGFLAHESWDIMNGFVYTKDYNNHSIVVGKFKYNPHLSAHMQKQDPAPQGYFWWVAEGTTLIDANGVFHAYPLIAVGKHSGKFALDYMVGDSHNGLNVHRSNGHEMVVVNVKSPSLVKTNNNGEEIQVKWTPPAHSHGILGYYIFRDGKIISLVKKNVFTDKQPLHGKHAYSILPVYNNGSYGVKSLAKSVCYSPCGNAMDFDGINDKVMIFDAPSLRMGKYLTMEAWFKMGMSEQFEPRLISKGGPGVGYELLLTQLKSEYAVEFRLPFATLKSIEPIKSDKWYHVAAVYDGQSMRLYINGKPDCARMAHGYIANTTYPMTLGKSSMKDANFFHGDIDDVRVWKVARTGNEIFENFSSRVSPDEKGLVGNWRMSEGCSIQTCDNSAEGNDGFLSGCCFCAEIYPFVEKTSNQNNYGLVVPVMNYREQVKPPKIVDLEFKINPKLVQFEGIITENTQLEGYVLKTFVSPDGNIRVKAGNYFDKPGIGDVLLYVDLKPLVPHLVTQLKFNSCTVDGASLRVASGSVISTALPAAPKASAVADVSADDLMNIFPNPATTCLNVELGELASPATLSVVNASGQEMYRQIIEPNSSNAIHKIDLLGFSKGIYLINLQADTKVHVKKFAVN
jgi:hypothetical protein